MLVERGEAMQMLAMAQMQQQHSACAILVVSFLRWDHHPEVLLSP